MDYAHISTFIDLMDSRSFNRTAGRLNITQSTVSHRIQALEKELNVALFSRSRGGTTPTPAGDRFLEHAHALAQQWNTAKHHVELSKGFEKALRIGFQHDLSTHMWANTVGRLRQEFPDTRLNVELDYSLQMNRDVLNGELDLAVVYTQMPLPDLHFEHIGDVPYVLVSDREISVETYIFPDISAQFSIDHRLKHPELTGAPITCGKSRGIMNMLQLQGGASYLMIEDALKLCDENPEFQIAPNAQINQAMYICVNLRHRHDHRVMRIKKIIKS
ncbi:MAG: LysR family transcriptional regulator [Halocynthiibacter sp.]